MNISVRFRPFLAPQPRADQPRSSQFIRQQRSALLTDAGVCFDYLLFVLYLFALTSTVLVVFLLYPQVATTIARQLHNTAQVVSWSQTH